MADRAVLFDPGFLPWDAEFDGARDGNLACDDCGLNILEAGEYYMLRDDVWESQLGLGRWNNLCVGCLESRLGRRINFADLIIFPRLPWMKPDSERLAQRMASKEQTNE
jgi:hypothetical protein